MLRVVLWVYRSRIFPPPATPDPHDLSSVPRKVTGVEEWACEMYFSLRCVCVCVCVCVCIGNTCCFCSRVLIRLDPFVPLPVAETLYDVCIRPMPMRLGGETIAPGSICLCAT
jgi:hypothetical protein